MTRSSLIIIILCEYNVVCMCVFCNVTMRLLRTWNMDKYVLFMYSGVGMMIMQLFSRENSDQRIKNSTKNFGVSFFWNPLQENSFFDFAAEKGGEAIISLIKYSVFFGFLPFLHAFRSFFLCLNQGGKTWANFPKIKNVARSTTSTMYNYF